MNVDYWVLDFDECSDELVRWELSTNYGGGEIVILYWTSVGGDDGLTWVIRVSD